MKDDSRNDTFDKVDAAIDAIKADVPSAADISAAAERARAAIENQRGPQAVVSQEEEAGTNNDSWNSIEDYIAAIPAYLAKELSPQQTMLFEEETRSSIPLRRALNDARGRDAEESDFLAPGDKRRSPYRWLAAVATVAAVAVAMVIAVPDLPSFNQSQLAQVDEIDGELFQIVDGQLEVLQPGTWINGRQRIRSANGSSALITLDDGSQIEVDERSELSMTRRSSGNRIDVSRGRILVVASPQGSGTLDVFTDDFTVSVTGTIFEVAHGAKGSRVAVIEGSVDVLMQGNTANLEPGDVLGSRQEVYALNIADEISWSENADEYIAMLQEVVALQQDIQAIIDTPNRFSTRLLDLAPAETAMYVAVPNAPEKIVELYDVVRDRLENSTTLEEAWAEFEEATSDGKLDEVMSWLRDIGYALGDETVFTLAIEDNGDGAIKEDEIVPVLLSEVDADSFRAAFDNHIADLQAALEAEGIEGEVEIAIVEDPADAVDDHLSILLYEDILVASIGTAPLQEMLENLQAGSSAFVGTELHTRLQYSYGQGTEVLNAIDIAKLLGPIDIADDAEAEEMEEFVEIFGLDNAEHLIAQYNQENGMTNMTADMYFDGDRQGLMSWLANPGPMGSLEFFSTDTTFVGAALMREPLSIMEEFEPLQLPDDFDAYAELELFYNVIGILGGEFAFGLDGPALPSPAWKVVIEAYDETVLQQSIESSAAQFNEMALNEEEFNAEITVTPANVSGYSGYHVALTAELAPGQSGELGFDFTSASFNYAFVDGYLIAAADEALIGRAIGFYESGSGLHTDSDFQDLMARDGYLDFSAITFSRIGELLSDLMGSLPAGITPEQEAALAQIDTDVGPSFSSALALSDRIHLAHNGSSQLSLQFVSQLAVLAPLLESAADQFTEQQPAN